MSTSHWEQIKLGDATSKVGSGSTPKGGRDSYHVSGVPLIRSQNVRVDGFSDEGLVYIDEEQAANLANVTVSEGDVLLNITGASIGRVTVAPPHMTGARATSM
jgi:type I restriction enzyme S subunit